MKPFSATRKQLSRLAPDSEEEEANTEAKEEEEKSLRETMMERLGKFLRYYLLYSLFLEYINPQLRHVVVFSEGGHHVHLDRPDLVFPKILNFLEPPAQLAKL